MRRSVSTTLYAVAILSRFAMPAAAASLKETLTGLYGGGFQVSTDNGKNIAGTVPQPVVLPDISSSVGATRGLIPVPSGSTGFTYVYDPQLDLMVRQTESLGPIFTERAQTFGQTGHFGLSFAYSHVRFSTFQGAGFNNGRTTDLNALDTTIPAGAQLVTQPGQGWPGIKDDYIDLRLRLGLALDSFILFGTYAVTDNLDVGLGLTLTYVDMSGKALAQIVDPLGDSGVPGMGNRLSFGNKQLNAYPAGGLARRQGVATDQALLQHFSETRFGAGDVYLRGKYHFLFADQHYVDAAAALTVTLPTGGANDFLGFNDVTATPLIVFSRSFGIFAPHLNAGYAIRSQRDVGQALWAAGADVKVFRWLTVVPDVLAFYDVNKKATAIPTASGTERFHEYNDIYQYSLGLKLNPYKQFVWGVNFQFPLNREGLRADIIYTTQFEYTF